jgi:hypothetical protein
MAIPGVRRDSIVKAHKTLLNLMTIGIGYTTLEPVTGLKLVMTQISGESLSLSSVQDCVKGECV